MFGNRADQVGQKGGVHLGMIARRGGVSEVQTAHGASVRGQRGDGDRFDEVLVVLGEELVEGFQIPVGQDGGGSSSGEFRKDVGVDLVEAVFEKGGSMILSDQPSVSSLLINESQTKGMAKDSCNSRRTWVKRAAMSPPSGRDASIRANVSRMAALICFVSPI